MTENKQKKPEELVEWTQEFLDGVNPEDFLSPEELPPEAWTSTEEHEIIPVTPKRAERGLYSTDKPGKSLTRELTETERKKGINTAGKGEIPTRVLYAISPGDLPGVKHLSYFEMLEMFACEALYQAGNEYVSLDNIYEAMGGVTNINSKTRESLLNSLLKLNSIHINIDNTDEVESGAAYAIFKYYGSILPFSLEYLNIRGRVVHNGIHLLREPPVYEFARLRRQVATVNIKALQNGLEIKESNIQLRDNCLRHVLSFKSFMNTTNGNKKAATTILAETLYKETGITTKKQRQRLPARLQKIFDGFISGGLINGYLLHYDKNKKFTKITFEPIEAGGLNNDKL